MDGVRDLYAPFVQDVERFRERHVGEGLHQQVVDPQLRAVLGLGDEATDRQLAALAPRPALVQVARGVRAKVVARFA